jgi:thioredoxin reductase (NADPH)
MNNLRYDIVIIGGGIAGLTAGLYASRAGMDTLLLEGVNLGGQAILTDLIENFPGFPDGISGIELINRIREQAVKFGLKIESEKADKIIAEDKLKNVQAGDNNIECLGIILAPGAKPMMNPARMAEARMPVPVAESQLSLKIASSGLVGLSGVDLGTTG